MKTRFPSANGTETDGPPIALADDPDDAADRIRPRVVEGGWATLRVIECRGIAVASFTDLALINDLEIREVDRELRGLIAMGHHRIVLDFDHVVRLSSQVIGLVLQVYRRCTAAGGTLKLCRIDPGLREVFALTGVFLAVDIYPDLRAALASDWPAPAPRRPAPEAPTIPFARPEEPVDPCACPPAEVLVSPPKPTALAPIPRENGAQPRHGAGADEPRSRPGRADPRVGLIVRNGRARGQVLPIPAPRFLIGRDRSCHLRAQSPLVSRFHALIEQRDGRVFLRDLGSTNTTVLGDRTLPSFEEVEVADGQTLQIGPMQFTFAIAPVAVPGPIAAAPAGALGQDPHLRPLIQCPHCGTDGWFSVDQLLLALARAVSQPPANLAPLQALVPGGAAAARLGTANGSGNGRACTPSGAAVTPTLESKGDGPSALPSSPRPGISSPVEIPAVVPEDDEPDFPDVLDLLPFDIAAAPTEEFPARPHAAPVAARSLDIDFCCPQCGAPGSIPVDQLGHQFHCQACQAKLYADESGGLAVGDIAERPRGPNAFEDPGPDALGRAIGRWQALPRPARIAVAVAASVLFIALVRWVVTAPSLPPTLKERAIFVAEAFAHEDGRRLQAIAAPGSSSAVTKWLGQVRPRFWKGKLRKVLVKVRIEQQDKKKGKATLLAQVSAITGAPRAGAIKRPSSRALEIPSGRATRGPAPPARPDDRTIDLRLCWVLGRDGTWLLDGTRTFAAAQPSRPAQAPGRPSPRGVE